MLHVLLASTLCAVLSAAPLSQIRSYDFSSDTQKQLLEHFNTLSETSEISNDIELKVSPGWNTFNTPETGLHVKRTFHDLPVEIVAAQEVQSRHWAVYSQKHYANTLTLNYLEPHTPFFIYATEATTIPIKFDTLNITCNQLMQDPASKSIIDSGKDAKGKENVDDAIRIRSRYLPEYKRGVYDDSRILLIYPKSDINTTDLVMRHYGPANPPVKISYNRTYENKPFFIYDYYQRKCFKGYFPSKNIPPFPNLSEINSTTMD